MYAPGIPWGEPERTNLLVNLATAGESCGGTQYHVSLNGTVIRFAQPFGKSRPGNMKVPEVQLMPFPTAIVQCPADQPAATSAAASAYGPSRSTESFICRALNVFIDSGLIAPEEDHLELITRFALKAREFFFASALFLPEQIQLDHFFDEFVRLCAVPTPPQIPTCAPSGIDAVAPQV